MQGPGTEARTQTVGVQYAGGQRSSCVYRRQMPSVLILLGISLSLVLSLEVTVSIHFYSY